MTQTTRILILGGGYVAIKAAHALRRSMQRENLDVTVVSRDNFHVFHGFVAEMLTGRIQPGQIISPARRIFDPARVHLGEIERIDLENRTVTTSRHLDGREHVLAYDHVVISLGSIDNLDLYPGIAEHSFKLKTYDECFRLRNHIIDMLELADVEPDEEERRRLLTFVIAGGGYAGVEVASELMDYLVLLSKKEYSRLRREEMRVVLIHHGEHILPELYAGKGAAGYGNGHPRLVAVAEKHLRKLGVEVVTGARVSSATSDAVVLQSGGRIPTRTIVSAVGTKLPPILDTLPVPKDERGRIVTDEFMQVEGMKNVWAAGDCAAVPHPKGGTCPSVALYALAQGKQIGHNILRTIRRQAPRPLTYSGIGQACSLGRRFAVSEIKGIELTGWFSWIMWRMAGFQFVPTRDRKLRLIADWLIWPLVGRDIVEFRVGEGHSLEHMYVEAGDVIVRQGDVSRRIYVIQAGEVELIRHDGEGDTPVRILGPGHHFGNGNPLHSRRLDATVRARSPVHLMTIGHGHVTDGAQVVPTNLLLADEA